MAPAVLFFFAGSKIKFALKFPRPDIPQFNELDHSVYSIVDQLHLGQSKHSSLVNSGSEIQIGRVVSRQEIICKAQH
jgi:hypothetical protein